MRERVLRLKSLRVPASRAVRVVLAFSLFLNVLACSDNDTQSIKGRGEDKASSKAIPSGQESPSTRVVDTGDPNTFLPQLAEHRWKLIIDGDLQHAYDYLSPDYRAKQERNDYAQEMRGRPVAWVSANYDSHECEGSATCNVNLRIIVRLQMPGTEQVESLNMVTEQWVKSGVYWYFVPNLRR